MSIVNAGTLYAKLELDIKPFLKGLEQAQLVSNTMAKNLSEMVAELEAAQKGTEDAGKAAEKSASAFKKFSDSVKKNEEEIKKAGKIITGFGAAITGASALFINAGADLAETSDKFNFTFREIRGEGAKALRELQENYGLSSFKAKELTANTAGLLKGFEASSKEALELSLAAQKIAVDLTSMNNVQGGVVRSSEAITKAMLGERDGLQVLNVKLDEADVKQRIFSLGQEKLTGNAMKLARAKATLALITEQSTDAIGNYAETSKSAANQMKLTGDRVEDLTGSIGTKLLPAFTPLITGFNNLLLSINEWIDDNPELSKGIILVTAGLGGLALAVGPLLIALPSLVAGFDILKVKLMEIGPLLGKIALAAGAFYAGWELGKAIDEAFGLSEALQDLNDKIQPTVEEFHKMSMIKMGFSEHAKDNIALKESLVEVARQIDPTVNGLREAARTVKANKEQYEALDPELRKVVDGMTQVREAVIKVSDSMDENKTRTRQQTEEVLKIMSAARDNIKELTQSELDFKLYKLEQERKKELEILEFNKATKEELVEFERSYHLRIDEIRSQARNKRLEEEKKQKIEDIKKAKIAEKEELEKVKKERQKEKEHSDYILSLRKIEREIFLKDLEERDGKRAAEKERVRLWNRDQHEFLAKRLADGKVTFQQHQIEIAELHQSTTLQMQKIEEEARRRNEEEEKNSIARRWQNFKNMVTKKQEQLQEYFTIAIMLNDLYSGIREMSLQSWYDSELSKIQNSLMTNEEKDKAIMQLDNEMDRKKAEMTKAQAKREKAIAIAQAIANTAVAITTAIKAYPWPASIPAIAFAVLTGALALVKLNASYNAPDINSFAPSSGSSPGTSTGGSASAAPPGKGGSVSSGIGPKGAGGSAGVPKFATGTGGFIPAMTSFIAGDPLSPELVELGGNLDDVSLSVTPLGERMPAPYSQAETYRINNYFTFTSLDSEGVREMIEREGVPVISRAIETGIISVPRRNIY